MYKKLKPNDLILTSVSWGIGSTFRLWKAHWLLKQMVLKHGDLTEDTTWMLGLLPFLLQQCRQCFLRDRALFCKVWDCLPHSPKLMSKVVSWKYYQNSSLSVYILVLYPGLFPMAFLDTFTGSLNIHHGYWLRLSTRNFRSYSAYSLEDEAKNLNIKFRLVSGVHVLEYHSCQGSFI